MPIVLISNVAENLFKSRWFLAIFVGLLTVVSIACGSSQTGEQPPGIIKSTDITESTAEATEEPEPTLNVKPDPSLETRETPKSPSSDSTPKPTDTPKPTQILLPSKTIEIKHTPTPLPKLTPAQLPEKKVFDRSHHVATAADLVKLADPDTKKALLNPDFLDANEAEDQYSDSELVIGLSVN